MKRLLCRLLLALPLANVCAQADTDTTYTLEQVVVKGEKADPQVPFTLQTIGRKSILAKSTGQEPTFLLSETPGITMYSESGSGQGYSYVRLRGIDQSRLNVTLDGVPMNEPEDQGFYFSNFPDLLNGMSSLQIQRGVGTSKYGTASYGGSLEFSGPMLFDQHRTVLGAGYGSFNTYRVFAEHNSGIRKNVGLYARMSHMHSDGYKERASNDGQSVLLSTGLFKKKHVLKLTVLAGRQQNGLAWLGVSMDDINQNPRTNANGVEEKDQFLQTFEVLQHIWQLKKGFLKTSVYHSYVDGNYNFDFNAFLRMPSDSILYNYAFRSHLVGAYSYYQLETKRLQWSVGVHGNTYTRRHIGSMRDGAWFDLYENHGTKSEASGFTRAMYKLGKLGIYGDVQVRNAMFAYDGSVPFEARQWLFVNPRAGVSYAFSKLLDVYASYGSTGREPTRNNIFGGNDDLLADDNGQPLTFITDPEYVQNGEAGIRMKGKNWRANLNGFLMRFRNEIVLNGQFGPNALPLGSGVDLSRRAGIELDASYSFTPKLTVSHASSYMQSVIEEGNVTFSPILAPRFIAFQEATYTSGKWSAAVSARYQSASFIDLGNTFTLDPYWLFNARAAVQVGKVRLGLHLNNLGNKQYFNNAAIEYDVNGSPKPYYFVQAPFHLHVTVTYTF